MSITLEQGRASGIPPVNKQLDEVDQSEWFLARIPMLKSPFSPGTSPSMLGCHVA